MRFITAIFSKRTKLHAELAWGDCPFIHEEMRGTVSGELRRGGGDAPTVPAYAVTGHVHDGTGV